MKHSLIATFVALAGYGCCPAQAQIQVDSGATATAPRLAALQAEGGTFPEVPSIGLFGPAVESSPFDRPAVVRDAPSGSLAIAEDQSGADSSAQRSRLVDRLATGVASGTEYAPQYWSATFRTPNPVVDYMRLQWCADGLWDNYGAERAAQCAKQQQRIAGHHRACGHCSHRSVAGCAAQCGAAEGCDAQAPINRYLGSTCPNCQSQSE